MLTFVKIFSFLRKFAELLVTMNPKISKILWKFLNLVDTLGNIALITSEEPQNKLVEISIWTNPKMFPGKPTYTGMFKWNMTRREFFSATEFFKQV